MNLDDFSRFFVRLNKTEKSDFDNVSNFSSRDSRLLRLDRNLSECQVVTWYQENAGKYHTSGEKSRNINEVLHLSKTVTQK